MNIQKAIAILAGLIVIFTGVYYMGKDDDSVPTYTPGEPTNFVKVGLLTFATTTTQDTMYFSYPNMGGPTTTMQVELDAESICKTSTGAIPCVAMNTLYHIPFGNKRAILEGIEKEAKLTVRKISVLQENEPVIAPGPGIIYMPWAQAVAALKSCMVSMVVQAHSLNVELTLKDGKKYTAVEPTIDEVFRVLDTVRDRCGDISIATE